MKLIRSNVNSISKADIVLIGLPDESKSHAKRKGASRGPDYIRSASDEYEYFERDGKLIPISPMAGDLQSKKIFDFGNVDREDLYRLVFDVATASKIPIVLGGDHSITTLSLNAVSDALGAKLSLLYFDAHPDFVTSTRDYYGSVLSDSIDYVDFSRSLLIGTRGAEPEELLNIQANNLKTISPLDILERGVRGISKQILSRCGQDSSLYISIDLDCIDPGIAPGVSVPTPGGITPLELIFLVKKACEQCNVVGLDIVELTPDFDLNNNTANIAARTLMESMASMKIRQERHGTTRTGPVDDDTRTGR
jgi:agmatinase